MNTNTPRDNQGQFESWATRVNEAGSYNRRDAALGAALLLVGAALLKGVEWAYKKVTK